MRFARPVKTQRPLIGLLSANAIFQFLPIGIVMYGYIISWLEMDQPLTIFITLNLALPVIMPCAPALRHIPWLAPSRIEDVSLA